MLTAKSSKGFQPFLSNRSLLTKQLEIVRFQSMQVQWTTPICFVSSITLTNSRKILIQARFRLSINCQGLYRPSVPNPATPQANVWHPGRFASRPKKSWKRPVFSKGPHTSGNLSDVKLRPDFLRCSSTAFGAHIAGRE